MLQYVDSLGLKQLPIVMGLFVFANQHHQGIEVLSFAGGQLSMPADETAGHLQSLPMLGVALNLLQWKRSHQRKVIVFPGDGDGFGHHRRSYPYRFFHLSFEYSACVRTSTTPTRCSL